jgi:hypothetical protein
MVILNSFVLPVLLGVLSSLLVVMFVEYMRKPTLMLDVSPPDDQKHGSDHPAREMRCLRVRVSNKDLPPALRWMRRETAAHCRASVRFEFLEGASVFSEAMSGRWAASPEPVPMEALIGATKFQIWDPNRMAMASEMSIPAGESEELDIAVRCDSDAESYGWNNQSYQPPYWKNPRWKLDKGRYRVRVTIRSAGSKVERAFHMNNDGRRQDFLLQLERG